MGISLNKRAATECACAAVVEIDTIILAPSIITPYKFSWTYEGRVMCPLQVIHCHIPLANKHVVGGAVTLSLSVFHGRTAARPEKSNNPHHYRWA